MKIIFEYTINENYLHDGLKIEIKMKDEKLGFISLNPKGRLITSSIIDYMFKDACEYVKNKIRSSQEIQKY